MKRRDFLLASGAAFLSASFSNQLQAAIQNNMGKVKPIEGSWFEFQHPCDYEAKYWNDTLKNFSETQWDTKVKEIADSGIRYLVLISIADDDKSFYPSAILPKHEMGCDDPLEAILSAADKYGIKFFVSNDYYGNWENPYNMMTDQKISKLRLMAMNEVAEKYMHHKSFYGWYFPNEAGINGYFDDFFINYVNTCSEEAAKLSSDSKILIAPYGIKNIKPDDKYVRQLELLNVDFIAYQDGIGVKQTEMEESPRIFERLYNLHKKAAKSRLWADVEVFQFEEKVYQSALIPAPADRVIRQLEAVSPYVEKIFIYKYPGLMNKPGTKAFVGYPDSEALYKELVKHKYFKR